MKILYLSQTPVNLKQSGIYTDLINTLVEKGHEITIVCADSHVEKTYLHETCLNDGCVRTVTVKIADQFGANIFKKGLIILTLENKIKSAIKKYLKNNAFHLILYATPPITFAGVIKYCKKKFGAKSYLMLKDIFPQNALDMGMIKKTGLKGLIYRFLRKKEEKLYALSDKIGCMSQGNVDYLLSHNSIAGDKAELFPNALIVKDVEDKDKSILSSYCELEKTTFCFGGNLGIPQGLDFLSEAIMRTDITSAHFFIVGKGSEKDRIYDKLKNQNNVTLIDCLPSDQYNKLCSACDVGIVSLDSRFTIPNYPSRILSYMRSAMPILAVTDNVTDIKNLVQTEALCGKWCLSGDFNAFKQAVEWFCSHSEESACLGKNGRNYFEKNFDISKNIYKIERMENENV